jgi:hypothetical protein
MSRSCTTSPPWRLYGGNGTALLYFFITLPSFCEVLICSLFLTLLPSDLFSSVYSEIFYHFRQCRNFYICASLAPQRLEIALSKDYPYTQRKVDMCSVSCSGSDLTLQTCGNYIYHLLYQQINLYFMYL